MSLGPSAIFDKSAIQCLSLDEACLFGNFFRITLTPIFFVETLADLEKEAASGRTAEQVVGSIASKTAGMTADPNVHHLRICRAELHGERIDTRHHVPAIEGGRPVVSRGKRGRVYKQSPELDALNRWQRQEFSEIERLHAKAWRAALQRLNLETVYQSFRAVLTSLGKPRSFADAKALACQLLQDRARAEHILGYALHALSIPTEDWPSIHSRWREAGQPPLPEFSPYAAHVTSIDLFFELAVGADLISRDRASNRVDMAYLYYLPFCQVFISNDKLHAKTARLFMDSGQEFLWGGDFKSEMRRLDEHYSSLPEDVLAQGLWRFARHPPDDDSYLTTRLWNRFLPGWSRTGPSEATVSRSNPELIGELREATNAPTSDAEVHVKDADFIAFERIVPVRMGKWRVVPPGTEDHSFPPFK